jgi:hypothetical protein
MPYRRPHSKSYTQRLPVSIFNVPTSIRRYYIEALTRDLFPISYGASHVAIDFDSDDLAIQLTEKITIQCE